MEKGSLSSSLRGLSAILNAIKLRPRVTAVNGSDICSHLYSAVSEKEPPSLPWPWYLTISVLKKVCEDSASEKLEESFKHTETKVAGR